MLDTSVVIVQHPRLALIWYVSNEKKVLLNLIQFSVPIAKSGHTLIMIPLMSFLNFLGQWTDL